MKCWSAEKLGGGTTLGKLVTNWIISRLKANGMDRDRKKKKTSGAKSARAKGRIGEHHLGEGPDKEKSGIQTSPGGFYRYPRILDQVRRE